MGAWCMEGHYDNCADVSMRTAGDISVKQLLHCSALGPNCDFFYTRIEEAAQMTFLHKREKVVLTGVSHESYSWFITEGYTTVI
jgi:predicted small metal-binding protein